MESGIFLVYNAKIWYTGHSDHTWMTFNKTSGHIISLGKDNAPVTAFTGNNKKDYGRKRIFPGFHDSHIHVASLGQSVNSVDLKNCKSIEEFQERLRTFVAAHPSATWFWGRHWEQDQLGRYPNKEDVDAVCADKPVLLNRVCGHIAVANSKALQMAGISEFTSDPQGGVIDKYDENHHQAGKPTGILREGPAINMVYQLMTPTSEDITKYIKDGMDICMKNGLTSVHSLEEATWKQYCQLADAKELPIRVFFSAYWIGKDPGNFPAPLEQRGDLLSCDRIKLFSDGSLGGCTAAMSKPFVNTNDCGVLIHKQGDLNQYVHAATAAGYRLEIHAIGDAAADSVLEALEVGKVAPEKRPILTHCQFLRPDIMDKMKQLGVVANIQPTFVPTDASYSTQFVPDELLQHSYPWRTLIERGIPCAGGSDAPVEPPEPLLGMYDAIFRRVGGRFPENKNIFRPEECLSVQQAVDLYTKDGAFATMREQCLGQLLPGYLADFVVLNTDVVEDPEKLLEAKVEELWIAGHRKL